MSLWWAEQILSANTKPQSTCPKTPARPQMVLPVFTMTEVDSASFCFWHLSTFRKTQARCRGNIDEPKGEEDSPDRQSWDDRGEETLWISIHYGPPTAACQSGAISQAGLHSQWHPKGAGEPPPRRPDQRHTGGADKNLPHSHLHQQKRPKQSQAGAQRLQPLSQSTQTRTRERVSCRLQTSGYRWKQRGHEVSQLRILYLCLCIQLQWWKKYSCDWVHYQYNTQQWTLLC